MNKRVFSLWLSISLALSLVGSFLPTVSVQAATSRYTVLVLDTSSSEVFKNGGTVIYTADTAIEQVKSAAKQFLRDVLKATGDNYVAVVSYKDTATVVSEFTQDISGLEGKIDGLSASSSDRSVTEGLTKADSLISGISDREAIKNVVLFTTGMTDCGASSYTGLYSVSTVGSGWYSESTNIRLYAYANSAIEAAEQLKTKANLYTIGLFQEFSGMPQQGQNVVSFFKMFTKDLASVTENYYEVYDPDKLKAVFGEVAKEVVEETAPPVIVVPGIMGSRLLKLDLAEKDRQVWPPLTDDRDDELWGLGALDAIHKHYGNQWSSYMRNESKLAVPELSDSEYGALSAYESIIKRLKKEFPDRTVLFFSYDWRKDNTASAEKLKEAIDSTLEETGQTKVELVCHSMGGLVASKYYAVYGSDKLDRIITLGTPYEGAPYAVNAVLNHVLDEHQELESNLGLSTDIKKGYDGVAQLVSSIEYNNNLQFTDGGGSNRKRKYIEKSKTYTYTTLTEADYTWYLKRVFPSSRVDNALTFQSSILQNKRNVLLNYDKSYFVVGKGQLTWNGLVFEDGEGKLVEYSCNNDGDGTVPRYSSTMMQEITYLKGNNRYLEVSSKHNDLVSNADALKYVCEVLGEDIKTTSEPDNPKAYIVIRIACPVDVYIKHGNEVLDSTLNEEFRAKASFGRLDLIDNDETKLLALFQDNYDVLLNGTGAGKMEYEIQFYSADNKLEDSSLFSDVPITEKMIIRTNTDRSKETTLEVDEDGDGTIDKTIYPDDTPTFPTAAPVTVPSENSEIPTGGMQPVLVVFGVIVLLILVGGIIVGGVMLSKKKPEGGRPVVEPAPAMRAGSFTLLTGAMAGAVFPIKSGETLCIGRDVRTAQIILDGEYANISRRHCTISYNAATNRYTVTDLSSNGTFFANKTRLEKGRATDVTPGTVILLGDEKCSIRFM